MVGDAEPPTSRSDRLAQRPVKRCRQPSTAATPAARSALGPGEVRAPSSVATSTACRRTWPRRVQRASGPHAAAPGRDDPTQRRQAHRTGCLGRGRPRHRTPGRGVPHVPDTGKTPHPLGGGPARNDGSYDASRAAAPRRLDSRLSGASNNPRPNSDNRAPARLACARGPASPPPAAREQRPPSTQAKLLAERTRKRNHQRDPRAPGGPRPPRRSRNKAGAHPNPLPCVAGPWAGDVGRSTAAAYPRPWPARSGRKPHSPEAGGGRPSGHQACQGVRGQARPTSPFRSRGLVGSSVAGHDR